MLQVSRHKDTDLFLTLYKHCQSIGTVQVVSYQAM